MRLTNTVKSIYAIITPLQNRLLNVQRLLRSAELEEIDENIIKRIKSFSKKHLKVINDIFKSTQKACDFFERKYSALAYRIFFYINVNLFTSELTI